MTHTANRFACPHCGNRSAAHMQDNGLPYTHPDVTLLCVAPVTLGAEDSFGNVREDAISAGYLDAAAEQVCGMQWEPNQ